MKTSAFSSIKSNFDFNKLYQYLLCFFIGLKFSSTVRILLREFHRLLSNSQGKFSAIDLKLRYNEVQTWFSPDPIYREVGTAVYPPATYLQLAPLLHYPSFTFVRWLWAITTILCLIILIDILIKHSLVKTTLERVCIAFVVLSMYATGETIGNGQLTIHVLTALTGGLLLMSQRNAGWKKELLGSLLVIFALIKPTLAVPFLWMVLLTTSRFRPALMVGFGYLALAWVATGFQEGNLISLHREWLHLARVGATWGSGGSVADVVGNQSIVINEALKSSVNTLAGYGNIHSLLATLGLSQWNLVGTLVMLLALGMWIYWYRSIDIWIILGVTALITRFCTYHLVYDDLLVIFPMVAIIRLIEQGKIPFSHQIMGGFLLLITVFASIVRSTLRLKPFPVDMVFKVGQTSLWIALLVFLVYLAWFIQKKGAKSDNTLNQLSANFAKV